MMITIQITRNQNTVVLKEEVPVLVSDLMKKHSIPAAFPCGGMGICGKCKVRVEGEADECGEPEKSFLTEEERSAGIRLACFCRLTGDANIYVETPRDEQILDWSADSRIQPGEGSGRRSRAGRLGLACDVGTTTIVMRLYDLNAGELLAVESEANRQRVYGADVISRITACAEHGTAMLSQVIGEQLEQLAERCLARVTSTSAGRAALERTVLTGNTVMLHIFEGLAPASLALSPFTMQSAFGCVSRKTIANAPVYLPRCIGAFTGADLLCAILASEMTSGMAERNEAGPAGNKYFLLADIGTNGEMALAKPDGTILCCSAPAGPAFEGAGISMGMSAAKGAVSAVRTEDTAEGFSVYAEVIGGGEASGVCGSGLIDCIAAMLKLGAMDDTGYIEEDFHLPGTAVTINQLDVRQVQLAKAAICGGVRTLLHNAGIGAEEVSRFYIAGGFGSYLNLEAAAAIGLIPPELQRVAHFIGNAALEGAARQLLNRETETLGLEIARRSTELHLATDPYFTKIYIDSMSF